MSDTELVSGRLIPKIRNLDTLKGQAALKRFVITKFNLDPIELGADYDYEDHLMDKAYDEFGIVGNTLYKLEDWTETTELDFCKVDILEDGSYQFFACFYNGGAHWTEVFEQGLKKL